jgi:hypothetical protein
MGLGVTLNQQIIVHFLVEVGMVITSLGQVFSYIEDTR